MSTSSNTRKLGFIGLWYSSKVLINGDGDCFFRNAKAPPIVHPVTLHGAVARSLFLQKFLVLPFPSTIQSCSCNC